MKSALRVLFFAIGTLCFLTDIGAQPEVYLFSIDQDAVSGPLDFSFLNHPLTPADRIFVREGHFFRIGKDRLPHTADDERVKFFGVNLCFSANFPEARDADRIARRLSKLGVNLVRLHHMDSQPDRSDVNAGSLLLDAPYPTLNPVAVSRLRELLQALSRQGIYVNLNLHVGYTFQPARDGLPPWPAGVTFPSQSKPLHVFMPRMVELQELYARQVIEALQLQEDPVLAMVEINNESSLIYAWQSNSLDPNLRGEYQTELQKQWNDFLRRRYVTTDALRSAWTEGEPPGPDLLAGRPWNVENHAPAQGVLQTVVVDGQPTARVTFKQGGGVIILKQVGFSITAGRSYEAEVEIRADLPEGASRSIYWDVKQDVSPWRTVIGQNVMVTRQWQKFRMAFSPTFSMENIGRFGLSVEKAETTVEVRGATLRSAGTRGLAPGETLEAGDIALVAASDASVPARLEDYHRFLVDRDRSYLNRIAAAVRRLTPSIVPLAGTQVGFGGLLNLDSHQDLDFQDNHFYIDHYNFPHTSWDGRDWRIRNSSPLDNGLATFLNMAVTREWGKPFTLSEFNQPWPNGRGAQIDPLLAVFGAFQDWDGIFHFAYSHGRGWDDNVPNGFNLNGDWTKWPGFGQAAWLFRRGIILPGRSLTEITLSEEDRLRATRERRNGSISTFLAALNGYDPTAALSSQVGLVRGAGPTVITGNSPAGKPPAPPPDWNLNSESKRFLITASLAAGIFGPLGAEKLVAGPLAAESANGKTQELALLATALDDMPLSESRRVLISLPGAAWRSQPGANPPRPQQLVPYPETTDWWTLESEPSNASKPSGNLNGGSIPTWMERREIFLTLSSAAAQLEVYPLDKSGHRLTALPTADILRTPQGFRIHLQALGQNWSPWYEIIAKGTRRRT